jgi:hypothetical protein
MNLQWRIPNRYSLDISDNSKVSEYNAEPGYPGWHPDYFSKNYTHAAYRKIGQHNVKSKYQVCPVHPGLERFI